LDNDEEQFTQGRVPCHGKAMAHSPQVVHGVFQIGLCDVIPGHISWCQFGFGRWCLLYTITRDCSTHSGYRLSCTLPIVMFFFFCANYFLKSSMKCTVAIRDGHHSGQMELRDRPRCWLRKLWSTGESVGRGVWSQFIKLGEQGKAYALYRTLLYVG